MTNNVFIEAYGKLNAKQKEAVDTIEGPVMVIAGPGTGKTTILTLRIANILLKTDTPASGILALTFTESGAKNMKNKLRELIGERALEVPIFTFHGFARSILNNYSDLLEELSDRTPLSEVEAIGIIRDVLENPAYKKLKPLGDSDFYVQKIINAISDCKREAWTPEMLRSNAEELKKGLLDNPLSYSKRNQKNKTDKSEVGKLKAEVERKIKKCERTILLSEVYREYEDRKKESKKMDFDDLLFEILMTLRSNDLLLRNLQENYLYILIDEHQDTNDVQNQIVSSIADYFDSPNIFIVGDEKQGIFRFQGASIENFLSFRKKWPNIKLIALEENYRSHQNILDSAFSMIEQNYEGDEHKELRIKLSSNSENGKQIDVLNFHDRESEEQNLVDMIKSIITDQKEKTVAIICRKNSDIVDISNTLHLVNLEHSMERGIDIFSHKVGILFFELIDFFLNKNLHSLSTTVAARLWGLDFENQIGALKALKKGSLVETPHLYIKIQEAEKLLNQSPYVSILALAHTSGLINLITDKISVEVWRNITHIACNLIQKNNIEYTRVLLEQLVEYKKSSETKQIKITNTFSRSNITLITAHSAKGLEYDYVFIPFCNEDTWIKTRNQSFFIMPKEQEDEGNIKDERRLFFVATTRAKQHLILSRHMINAEGNATERLRFLDELDPNTIEEKYIEKKEPKDQVFDKGVIENIDKKALTEYIKEVILSNGLSVTALNHYAICPSRFVFKSILKVPEAPTLVSEKGSAMHFAISEIWKEKKKRDNLSKEEIKKIIDTEAQNYLGESLLSKNESLVILEDISEQSEAVSASLFEHFNQSGEIETEIWFETNEIQSIDGRNLEIRLHGKLDSVVEKAGQVYVYDYKTKEAMSENAIRGKTATSEKEKGSYFRQLVFYKLLIQSQKKYRDKEVLPSLVFLKPTISGECKILNLIIADEDIANLRSEISLLLEAVWSDKILDTKCADKSCNYCTILSDQR